MIKVLIMGAAGRDFHNFNVVFRENPRYEVKGFTATQIPNIEGRHYPKELSGKLYPKGIPIYPESDLTRLIRKFKIDRVVFSYSDVSHNYVMERASAAMAAGADFTLLAPAHTELPTKVPVIAICAVRTGSGKSQTSRKVVEILKRQGKEVVAVRHPMPYGDLAKQICQRYASHADLDLHNCTIEEREEFEPYLDRGLVVYAGIDYAKIARAAEKEADIIIWDGGNNDTPFFIPTLHITVVDPLRAGHERLYFPGETNFLQADIIVINKYEQATAAQLKIVEKNIQICNPDAVVINGASTIQVDDPKLIKGKRVVVVEDGPTVTHGQMSYGAGLVAAERYGAKAIIDPRPFAKGSIKSAYRNYPHMEKIIPALGYYPKQLKELEETLNAIPCDTVVVASPIDIRRVIKLNKPSVRVSYELEEMKGSPTLEEILTATSLRRAKRRGNPS